MPALLIFAAAAATAVPEVIVAGSRIATTQVEPANVTVLERADFDARKPADLADVLRTVAGVHVDSVGGRGGTGSIYVRGADPNYTLVLVNGVRVNDPTNSRGGSFDFSTFDIGDVERIEIVRGPYSAIHGTDAMAGVINIITRAPSTSEPDASVDASFGAYDTSNAQLRAAAPFAGGHGYVSAGKATEGEVVRGNDFDEWRVAGGVQSSLGQAIDMDVSARYSQSRRSGFPDDSGGDRYAVIRDTESRRSQEAQFGAGFTYRAEPASVALALGYFRHDEDIDSPGVAPGLRDPVGIPASTTGTAFDRYTATLTVQQSLTQWMTLAYGLDWQRDSGSSKGALDFGGGFTLPVDFALTRSIWAPFAEMRMESAIGVSAQVGVRYDHPADESSVTSPRVRIAYALPQNLAIAASWGRGYKLPSFYALGHPLVGNPALVAERSNSYEVSLSQTLGSGARWSLAAFDSEFRNAIDFDAGPPPQLVNRNRVTSRGVELAGAVKLGATASLDANVTYAHSRISDSDDRLRNRPDWRGSLAARWTPREPLVVSLAASYVGSSLDSSIPTGDVILDGYTRLDASAVWRLTPALEVYVAVDNLTDERYEQFVGFEARGIVPRAGIQVHL